MSAFGAFLRRGSNGSISFFCPGCECAHTINTVTNGWTFNESAEAPTFNPSVLVRSGHYSPLWKPGDACWCARPEGDGFDCSICHSFVRDGKIEFLGDSTHALAGQTVPLPPWPADYGHS